LIHAPQLLPSRNKNTLFQEVERFDLHGCAAGDSLIEEFDIALV
jgi:hypothetical protein